MIFVGIDPGAQGGIASITEPCYSFPVTLVGANKMPETIDQICTTIRQFMPSETIILMESQQARPTVIRRIDPETQREVISTGIGASSTWTFAQHYGELRGVLAALKLKVYYIRPHDWQRALGIPKKEKAESNTAWKNRLKQKAIDLFPALKVTKAVADALLIAEVCRRLYAGDCRERATVQQGGIWDDF